MCTPSIYILINKTFKYSGMQVFFKLMHRNFSLIQALILNDQHNMESSKAKVIQFYNLC